MPAIKEFYLDPRNGQANFEYDDGTTRVVGLDQAQVSGGAGPRRGLWRAAQAAISGSIVEARRREYDVLEWTPGEVVGVGMVRVPTAHKLGNNDFTLKIHRCITAGVTGRTEPTWATQDAILAPGTTSQTTDGSAVWKSYNLYHFDADNGNDSTGNGSQLTPYKTLAKATIYGTTATCAGMSGRAWCLKRGTVEKYTGTPPGSSATFGLQYARDASIDTMLNPERFNIFAYGQGAKPAINPTGRRYGIRLPTSTASAHHGYLTISDIEIPKITYTADDGGYSVSANSTGTPSHATPLHVKLFRLTVNGYETSAGTVNGSDCSGIWMTGAGVGVYDCVVRDVWDDGIWAHSTGGEFIGNTVYDVARSTAMFPTRDRGDSMQINSTLTGSPAHGIKIVGNKVSHTGSPRKHALICNPDAGGGASSYGYEIAWNDIQGTDVSSIGSSHHALYASSFVGDVHHNIVRNSGFGVDGSDTFFCIYAKDIVGSVHTNLVVSDGGTGVQAGIFYEASVLTGAGVSVVNNTVVSPGLPIEFGIRSTSGVAVVANNVIINAQIGVSAATGCTHGTNAAQDCTTPYSGVGTYSGGSLSGDLALLDYEPTPASVVVGAANASLAPRTDGVGRSRAIKPSIGAFEGYSI